MAIQVVAILNRNKHCAQFQLTITFLSDHTEMNFVCANFLLLLKSNFKIMLYCYDFFFFFNYSLHINLVHTTISV